MTTFTKTLKNYISQVINTEFNKDEILLKFAEYSNDKTEGDMRFEVNPFRVYVSRQKSKFNSDYDIIISKKISEMTDDDWKLFYIELCEMVKKTKLDNFKKIWLFDDWQPTNFTDIIGKLKC